MTLEQFLAHLNRQQKVEGGSEMHRYMAQLSDEARHITSELNATYQTPEAILTLFTKLMGKPVDASFRLFPPFYPDSGTNISIGKYVFIHAGCPRSEERRVGP